MSDLSCGYGTKIIINRINLHIKKGEFVCIIGPNGSGKTTLLKAITRIIKPAKGNIFLEGRDLNNIDKREIAKKMAVVSQNLPIVSMTVKEFVLLGRTPHYKTLQLLENKSDIEVVEHAISMTGIERLQNSLMSEISGGEVQLSLIARALAQEPWILLLDEPTAHLDITHQVNILDLIKRLNKDYQLTVIIILHDLNLASEYCDRLILMNNGQITKTGIPEEVLNSIDLEEVYKTPVVVEKNPLSNKPFVLIVPEEVKKHCGR
ncbi:MAG: ABC transporter ATP-binding protein [Syntrophorhabdaceae bacterium]|nr:ABC transporter ATP-binding protein [Syntrophorhabdaceae bacterium]MDI9562258.1 ABC transporter ATP-binding protein [Pseudomonadota bacterium]